MKVTILDAAEKKEKVGYKPSDSENIHDGNTIEPTRLSMATETPDENLQITSNAKKIVSKYVKWSASTSLIPIPYVNILGVTTIQLRMLKKLCDHYEIPFSENLGKTLIGSLIGGINVGLMSSSLLKVVPVFGLPISIISLMAVSASITYAVGIVFIYHFGSGGALEDFEPKEHKKNFESIYKQQK